MKSKKREKLKKMHSKSLRILELIDDLDFRISSQKYVIENFENQNISKEWYSERIEVNKKLKLRLISAYKNLNSK